MKMLKNINLIRTLTIIGITSIITTSCERDLSDEAVFASFPNSADIFTDTPQGLTDEFFVSIDPAAGANTEGFDVVDDVSFLGTSSIRIDVPAPNNPDGNFIGGVFLDRGTGRNLTQYDALTFYARASTTVDGVEFGYGSNFEAEDGEDPNRYRVVGRFNLTTEWRKIIVPIPNADVLNQVKGLFFFAAGSKDILGNDDPAVASSFDDNIGYVFWMDEIRYETLGTIANPRPSILNGQDISFSSFAGGVFSLSPFNVTSDVNGTFTTVDAAPIYFDFSSTNNSIASVSENGIATINNGVGTALITASISGVPADGSLELNSDGPFPEPTTPTRPEANVLSIYSDAYTAATTINFAPGFGGSTTQTTEQSLGSGSILSYTNNNFTGIMFVSEFEGGPTLDATNFGNISMDVFVTTANVEIGVQVRDVGPNLTVNTNTNNGQPIEDDVDYRFTISGLTPGQWTTIEMPLAGNLAGQRNNIGAIILTGGPDFILDNIYLYN